LLRSIALLLLCCCLAAAGRAQSDFRQWNNLVRKKIAVRDTIQIDSCSISNLTIIGADSSAYRADELSGIVYWKQKPTTDSIWISYRRLPLHFGAPKQRKSSSIINTNFRFQQTEAGGSNRFIDNRQLDLNGSYGRSFSLGNNQDVVSNSNFNLQANGYIADSVKIEAALTDNTIPFQPDGNTSRLQEFDQIAIRLSKNNKTLLLGDYNLNKPDAYFLNFTKRTQGLFLQSEDRIGRRMRNKAGLSVSVAKGEFARNIFPGQEGNQGPYRLTGNNGEQLFIVLAGTEKVYVDNMLQERGENADYVINYNTNEIRFMPRRPINQFSRIQVEFEYRTNNYLNSLFFAYDELSIGKWQVKLNAYANQDAKNQNYQQELTADQKNFLASLGDSIHNAYLPNIAPDTFAAGKVLYRIKDTMIAGIRYDSVYEYATKNTGDLFSVGFSFVGSGKGDYTLSGSNANGRVYQWVAPSGGRPGGDYAAVSFIITPKAHRFLSLAAEYKIDSTRHFLAEVAGSNKDLNTFSDIDDQSHKGIATKLIYEERRKWGKKDSLNTQWQLKNYVQYEYVQSSFRAIAPYRSVEFGREWSVPLSGNAPDEHWGTYATELSHRSRGKINYSISKYLRGKSYDGTRHSGGYVLENRRTNSGFQLSYMPASDSVSQIRLFKPTVFGSVNFGIHSLGASYAAEHNEVRHQLRDSLLPSSFYFDISTVYLKSRTPKRVSYNINYFKRRDYYVGNTTFRPFTQSDNLNLQLSMLENKNHQLQLTAAYRNLKLDTVVTNIKPEETGLGRVQYDGLWLKRSVSWSTLYEFGAGQEQKRTFTYLQVPAGQGMYNWIDYNQDGLQQLNEFVTALYPDQKLYIRIYSISNEYIRVNNMAWNQSVSLEPANILNTHKKSGKFLARFSAQIALQINNKILKDAGGNTFNPFQRTFQDSSILQTGTAFNNSVYFNRNSSVWGIDYNYADNSGKQLLNFGLTQVQQKQQYAKIRAVLSRSWTLTLGLREGRRGNVSAVADGSSYRQQFRAVEPSLIWLNKSALRIAAGAKYEERNNEVAFGGETAIVRSFNCESRFSKANAGIVQIRFTYSNISYSGSAAAPVAYFMLDGLKPGNNLLWFINWQRRLGKGLELFIEYEGRKSATDAVINTGRMSLKAIL
jgi:hypothetical protein